MMRKRKQTASFALQSSILTLLKAGNVVTASQLTALICAESHWRGRISEEQVLAGLSALMEYRQDVRLDHEEVARGCEIIRYRAVA